MTSFLSIISGPPTLTFHKPHLSVIPLSTRHFYTFVQVSSKCSYFSSLKKNPTTNPPKIEKKRIYSLILIIKTTQGQDQEKAFLSSSSVASLACAIPSFTECTIHFQLELCNSCQFFFSEITQIRQKQNYRYWTPLSIARCKNKENLIREFNSK